MQHDWPRVPPVFCVFEVQVKIVDGDLRLVQRRAAKQRGTTANS